jgi:phosphotriesterase-related protein
MSDNTDIRYQLETLKHGVYVAFDRMGIQVLAGCPMDEERYGVLIGLIGTGHADKVMISHDYIAHWLGRPLNVPEAALPLIANWHPTHLFKNVIPVLRQGGVTDEQIQTILVDNPRRLFGGE